MRCVGGVEVELKAARSTKSASIIIATFAFKHGGKECKTYTSPISAEVEFGLKLRPSLPTSIEMVFAMTVQARAREETMDVNIVTTLLIFAIYILLREYG